MRDDVVFVQRSRCGVQHLSWRRDNQAVRWRGGNSSYRIRAHIPNRDGAIILGVGVAVYLPVHVAGLRSKFRADVGGDNRTVHADSRRDFPCRLAGLFGRVLGGTDGVDWRVDSVGDFVYHYGASLTPKKGLIK